MKTKSSPKRKRKSDGPVKSEIVDNEREEEEKESAPTPKAKGKAKVKKAAGDDEDDNEDGSAKKKRKTVSRKPKAKVLSEDENHEEESPKKKQKTAGRKPKKTEEEVVKPSAKRSRGKDAKEFKSLVRGSPTRVPIFFDSTPCCRNMSRPLIWSKMSQTQSV